MSRSTEEQDSTREPREAGRPAKAVECAAEFLDGGRQGR